ncbi:hypothetical protein RJD24_03105 [Bacillaceae bacterium IKA-2]|nr:hypothetical protein RJD24_03105 [Bacillaceae bacterium IKA-2]
MVIVDQMFYDLELLDSEDLGRELLEIVKSEQKQNKHNQITVHQVVKIDRYNYTIILNLLESS